MSRPLLRRHLRCSIGLAIALAVAGGESAAQAVAPVEIQGALDAVAAPGLALAWGVLRGKDESTTEVVVRVDTDPKRYGSLDVVGIDPFTHTAKTLVALAPVEGTRLIHLPRAGFGDLPRTEWRFYAATAKTSDPPRLVVYYQGVPDTTPEFNTASQLAVSLAERLGLAQRAVKAK